MRKIFLLFVFISALLIKLQGQCTAEFSYSALGDSVVFNNLSQLDTAQPNITWSWEFGDGNIDSAKNPVHFYFTDGYYDVKLIISDSTCSDSITKRVKVCSNDCVWPGDANQDGISNNLDVIYLGLAYGQAGLSRDTVTNSWDGYPSPDWPLFFNNGFNHKHANSNGDSIVSHADTLAIILNYNKTHSKSTGPATCTDDPPLHFIFPEDSIEAGDTVEVLINLGKDIFDAQSVYGLAFTVNYNPDLVDSGSVSISFNNSALGNDLISVYKDFYSSGSVDAGVSRTDQLNTVVNGTIGKLKFVMEEDLTLKLPVARIFKLSFSDVTVLSNDESTVAVCPESDSVVAFEPTGITEKLSDEPIVNIYPNPASGKLYIESRPHRIVNLSLISVTGQEIRTERVKSKYHTTFSLPDNKRGLYILRITTTGGEYYKKVLLVDL